MKRHRALRLVHVLRRDRSLVAPRVAKVATSVLIALFVACRADSCERAAEVYKRVESIGELSVVRYQDIPDICGRHYVMHTKVPAFSERVVEAISNGLSRQGFVGCRSTPKSYWYSLRGASNECAERLVLRFENPEAGGEIAVSVVRGCSNIVSAIEIDIRFAPPGATGIRDAIHAACQDVSGTKWN